MLEKIGFLICFCLVSCGPNSEKASLVFGTYTGQQSNVVESILINGDLTFMHTVRSNGEILVSESGTYERSGGKLIFSPFTQFFDPVSGVMNQRGEVFVSYDMHYFPGTVCFLTPTVTHDYHLKFAAAP